MPACPTRSPTAAATPTFPTDRELLLGIQSDLKSFMRTVSLRMGDLENAVLEIAVATGVNPDGVANPDEQRVAREQHVAQQQENGEVDVTAVHDDPTNVHDYSIAMWRRLKAAEADREGRRMFGGSSIYSRKSFFSAAFDPGAKSRVITGRVPTLDESVKADFTAYLRRFSLL